MSKNSRTKFVAGLMAICFVVVSGLGALIAQANEAVTIPEDDLAGKTSLAIVHTLLLEDGSTKEVIETSVVLDLEVGSVVLGADFVGEYLGLQYLYSEPEELELGEEDNLIELFYEMVGDPFDEPAGDPNEEFEYPAGLPLDDFADNPDGLEYPEEVPAPGLLYPEPAPRSPKDLLRGPSSLLGGLTGLAASSYPDDHDNIEPPHPGSLALSKVAEPVEGTTNRWKVTLTLTGKNLPTTSDIVLVIDTSGSMGRDSGRIEAAKDAATLFVNSLLNGQNPGTRIALVSFASSVTPYADGLFHDADGKDSLISAINSLSANGGTWTQAGIKQARELLRVSTAAHKTIVLLSDGEPTYSYKIYNIENKDNWTSEYFSGTDNTKYTRDDLAEPVFNYTDNSAGSGTNMTTSIGSTGSWPNRVSYYYHHGNSAVAESRFAKAAGITVYSVGLSPGSSGAPILERIADTGRYYLSTTANLMDKFMEIAGRIAYAATSATIGDPIGEMFSIPDSLVSAISVNTGEFGYNQETITWTLETVSESHPASLTYTVEIHEDAESGVNYDTNGETTISYTNAFGVSALKHFPVPVAGINTGSIQVHYYRVNSSGEPVNSEGIKVSSPQDAELLSLPFSDGTSTNLQLNHDYSVFFSGNDESVTTRTIGGIHYDYSSAGATNPTTVRLTPSQPSKHVWFACIRAQIAVTVTANSGTFTYDGTDKTVSDYVVDGLLTGHVLSGITASGSGKNVGTYPVTFTGTPVIMDGDGEVVAENYVVTLVDGELKINPAQIAVTVTANSDTKVYNGDVQTVSGYQAPVGLLSGHTLSGIIARGSGKNVGTYPVTFTGTPVIMDGTVDVTENYVVTLVQGNLTITLKAVTVTADAQTKVYGDVDPALTYTYLEGDLVEGDAFTGTLNRATGENVGVYAINQGTLTLGGNYTINFVPGTLTIKPKQITVTADTQTKVYGDADPTLAYQVTSGSLVAGDGFTGALTRVAGETVGSYAVNQGTLTLSGNYDLTYVGNNLTITKKTASVTPHDKSKTYGDTDPLLTGTLVGFLPEDNVTATYSRAAGEAVGTYTISATLSPAEVLGNYEITYNTGTLTINPAEGEDLSIDNYTGIYDGAPHSITVTNLIDGDRVLYSTDGGETWSEENPEYTYVGEYIVPVKVENPNYEDRTGSGTVKITAKPLTITAKSAEKQYDGTPLTRNEYEHSDLVDGDSIASLTITGSQTNVGSTANVPSNAEITRAEGEEAVDVTHNYDITYVNGMLTVTSPPYIPETPIDDDDIPLLNKEDHFAYIIGYPDNTVRPEGRITREEVAAVFFRLLDANYRDIIRALVSDFPDVPANRWSSKHIATLAAGTILEGYPDGTFKPGASITRAELATIAARFDELESLETNAFPDAEGHWAEKYINSAAAKGWVDGYPDGTFKPDQYITRAEFVTLVNRVLERKVRQKDILPEAKQFPDLTLGSWYYEAMQEAINSHLYERQEDGYEVWLEINYPELEM